MLAVTLGRNEMIQFLLSVCVNIFVQTRRGTVLHCALEANDLDLTVRIMQAIKDQPSLEKRKFLNLTNANQETVFHVIFKCFLQGETFPLLLCTVLSYSPYYDFKESGKQEQIFEDAKKTLNQLRDDEKRFKVIKTFKMDRNTRRDTIQAVCRSINYLCK
jgi:hypothetical protein